jgi:hypothetical protein
VSRLDGRVQKLEARANSGHMSLGSGEVWIELQDGRMLGEHGEVLSREEFEQWRLRLDAVVILPDNGRDDLEHLLSQGHKS